MKEEKEKPAKHGRKHKGKEHTDEKERREDTQREESVTLAGLLDLVLAGTEQRM